MANIKSELVKSFKNLLSSYFGKVYSESELKISEKVIGGIVEVINPDGSLMVAPDGEYAMEDGTSFVVKDGAIVEMIGVEMEPVMEEELSEHTDDEMKTSGDTESKEVEMDIQEDVVNIESSLFEIYNRVMEQESKIQMLEEKIMSMEEMMKSMTEQSMSTEKTIETFNKVVNELNTNIKTLATVPVQFSKVDTSVKGDADKQDKMNNLVSILSNNKK